MLFFKLTYDDIFEWFSLDSISFIFRGLTGVIDAAAAKRCFCLSWTDKRGFDLWRKISCFFFIQIWGDSKNLT